MRTTTPANVSRTRSASTTQHIRFNNKPAALHGDFILKLPLPDSRLWRLLSRVLDSPIVRAIVAALALYGVWTGAFHDIAKVMHDASGISALICGGFLQGAIAGHLVTGDIRGILFGALSGAAFGLIGDIASGWYGLGKWLAKPVLQGFAGGVLCGLQGQSFRSGFIDSTFFSALALIAMAVLPLLIHSTVI